MNGKKVKALRTAERPHPGRKHGGSKGVEPTANAQSLRRMRKFFRRSGKTG